MQTEQRASASHVAEATPSPVFVDTSGQRRKLLRRLTIGVVGVLCGYGCLLAVSFAGGPIPPNALLPVPGVPGAQTGGQPKSDANPATPGAVVPSSPHGSTRPASAPAGVHGSTAKTGGTNSPSASAPTAPNSAPGASTGPAGASPTTAGPSPSATTSSTHGPPTTPPGQTHKPTSTSTP